MWALRRPASRPRPSTGCPRALALFVFLFIVTAGSRPTRAQWAIDAAGNASKRPATRTGLPDYLWDKAHSLTARRCLRQTARSASYSRRGKTAAFRPNTGLFRIRSSPSARHGERGYQTINVTSPPGGARPCSRRTARSRSSSKPSRTGRSRPNTGQFVTSGAALTSRPWVNWCRATMRPRSPFRRYAVAPQR
jgi:hypothetical protein